MSSTTVIVKVVLLDDTEIEIPVQTRLVTSDFRDIVASQVNIRETQYFGLSFLDEKWVKALIIIFPYKDVLILHLIFSTSVSLLHVCSTYNGSKQ